MRERDDETQEPQYPLLTDIAGTVVVNPVRRIRIGVLLFALAIILGSGAGAYVSVALSGAKTDRHTNDLIADINRRTAERKANEKAAADERAYTQAVLEQNRRTLCELIPGAVPTSEIHARKLAILKEKYRCGTARDVLVPPGWSPSPHWPELPPGREGFFAPSGGPSPIPQPTVAGR